MPLLASAMAVCYKERHQLNLMDPQWCSDFWFCSKHLSWVPTNKKTKRLWNGPGWR